MSSNIGQFDLQAIIDWVKRNWVLIALLIVGLIVLRVVFGGRRRRIIIE